MSKMASNGRQARTERGFVTKETRKIASKIQILLAILRVSLVTNPLSVRP